MSGGIDGKFALFLRRAFGEPVVPLYAASGFSLISYLITVKLDVKTLFGMMFFASRSASPWDPGRGRGGLVEILLCSPAVRRTGFRRQGEIEHHRSLDPNPRTFPLE
jgi:hypothetical protein